MNRRTSASFGELLATWRTRRNLTQTALAAALGSHRNTIGRWERGEVLPEARGIVLELSRLLRLDEHEARLLLEASLTALAPYWTVPFLRNPCFTGRETLLQSIHAQLTSAQPVVLTKAAALSGLGGIGKTQLAVEYAYRHALEYTAVFWLAAETEESLTTSVQHIAEQLQLPERQATEQFKMVVTVRRWLTTHAGWLVIVDNVEDLDLLQSVLPPARQGALLFTTRHQTLGTLAQPLNVPPMEGDEGIALLLQRAHRPALPLSEAEAEAARELVHLLGGLPLALDQAGAYIDETGCSMVAYVRQYHQQRKQVMARRGLHGGAHPASVTTTLMLSMRQVEDEHPAGADLLRLCAFLHPEAIPEDLLASATSNLGPALGRLTTDPYQFDLALAALRNASLVTRHAETRTLSIHRLVQAVLQDQLEPAEVRLWSTQVIRAVNAAFPEPELSGWAKCERYLTHALACIPLITPAGSYLPEAGELLFKVGSYLMARGRYVEAKPLLEHMVAMEEQQHGTDHPMLIPRLEKQAELVWRQGKYILVEPILRRVLALEEQYLGPSHAQTAESLNNLAVCYFYQERYTEAEPLYQRALGTQEQQLGPEHPEVANTLNNLASLYRKQKRYEMAALLHQRALRIREQQLGPEHLDTAMTFITLAGLYCDQEKYEQAEVLCRRGLRIREQQLGSEHPDTALTLTNLALLCQKQEKYQQAEPLYQRALHIQEQQLGMEHPQTIRTLKKLAVMYREQGKDEQAEAMYQKICTINE